MPTLFLPVGAQALLVALQTPSPNGMLGIPVLLWGKPGVGKSSFLEQLQRPGFPVLTLLASIHDPTDFSGLPVLRDGEVHYARPAWLGALEKAGTGILFLDELTTAPPAVQAALLRVVLERRVGSHALPTEVRVVAAANPPEPAYGSWELSPALRNRFVHLQWDLPVSVFRKALTQGFASSELPDIDPAAHRARRPYWKYVIAAFLKHLPASIQTSPEATPYAFASPRSWDYLAHLLTSCELLDLTPAPRRQAAAACWELVEGCLGASLALTFGAFLRDFRVPPLTPAALTRQPPQTEKLGDAAIYVWSQQLVATLQDEYPTTARKIFAQAYAQLLRSAHATQRQEWVVDSMERLLLAGLLPDLLQLLAGIAGAVSQEEVTRLFAKIN